MRLPHFAWSKLNPTAFEPAAGYSFTGIETRPNEIVAVPNECGGIRILHELNYETGNDETEKLWTPSRIEFPISALIVILPGAARKHNKLYTILQQNFCRGGVRLCLRTFWLHVSIVRQIHKRAWCSRNAKDLC